MDITSMYEMGEKRERHIKKFKTSGVERDLKLINTDKCDNLFEVLPKIFDSVITEILGGDVNDETQIGVSFTHPDLNQPILIPFRPRRNVNGQILVDQIERLVQSNATLRLDDQLGTLRIIHVTPPSGEGHRMGNRFYSVEELLDRYCVVKIRNTDNTCLARALVVAMEYPNRFKDPKRWNRMRKGELGRFKDQRNDAVLLMEKAGLQNHKGPCGIPEIQAFQDVLDGYQIKIYSSEFNNGIMFQGKLYFQQVILSVIIILGKSADKILTLYHHNNHFDFIKSMETFFSRNHFCHWCNIAYNNVEHHVCKVTCPSCYATPPCKNEKFILCDICRRYFRNEKCFANHKLVKLPIKTKNSSTKYSATSSICDRVQVCGTCKKHLRGAEMKKHECGFFDCRTCKLYVKKEGI